MTSKTIETKINKAWRQACSEVGIPKKIIKCYTSTNTEMPVFYHLIKTHKPGPELHIRPIVSNRRGPSHKLSWMLCRLLKPLLKTVPSHLDNSLQLLNDIRNRPDSSMNKKYPFSLDVVSLYTSVPQDEAIEVLNDRLQESPLRIPFNAAQVSSLLTVILRNVYFQYNDKVYRQISGLPMGNNISAILAILYMDRLERQVITSFHQLGLYKRYVDDIFILTDDKEAADEIHTRINNVDPHIKFEIEHPVNGALSLLDFTVTLQRDGEAHFCFYRKEAKKNTFIHRRSAMPEACKTNSIMNEIARIEERCTTDEDKRENINTFRQQLSTRGYKNDKPHNTRTDRRNYSNDRAAHAQYHYFEFPYVNEATHRAINRVFKTAQLPVRTYCKNRNLRSLLSRKREDGECTMPNCSIQSKLCNKKNCVYSLTCVAGRAEYIGSTKRTLHQRVKEHLTSPTSSVYQHRAKCKGDFETNIISTDPTTNRLRVKEAIAIRERRPAINSKSECDELLHLIF